MLSDALEKVMEPKIQEIINELNKLALKYKIYQYSHALMDNPQHPLLLVKK